MAKGSKIIADLNIEAPEASPLAGALSSDEALVSALLGAADLRIRLVESPLLLGEHGHFEVSELLARDQVSRLSLADATSAEAWRAVVRDRRTVILDLLGLRRPARRPDLPATLSALTAAVPAGGVLGFMVAPHTLETSAQLELKQFLAEGCAVEWIAWFEFPFTPVTWAMVVARPASTKAPAQRLVDARGLPVAEAVTLIDLCRKRRGGDGERERVRHGPLPLDRPWTWWGLSRAAEEERKNTLELGPPRPLSEVARLRIARPGRWTVTELENPENLRDDQVGIVQGSAIGRDGSLSIPSRVVPRDEVDSRHLLEPGDVVIASVFRDVLRVGLVPPNYPPSLAHTSVMQLRFHDGIEAVERAAIVAYLRSARYARRMSEAGSSLGGVWRATGAAFEKIGVPRFDQRILDALARSAAARVQFSEWARELDERESAFFDAKSFRVELPAFLSRSRIAADQVQAASDVDTLEGRIRQRFPHPLAFRYETVAQMDHGSERVRATLECAEHIVFFLAFLGLANLGGGPTTSLQAWSEERGSLSLDWGKADSLLRETASKAYKVANPLATAVPEFERLHGALSDQASSLNQACRELRAWRNDESHLSRSTPDEVMEASERFAGHLRALFDAASFITQTPLVAVDDYSRDPHTDEPRARFAYLVGVSAAFKRSWASVEKELTRTHVGVRDVHGRFHSLYPWLIRRNCEKCKHAETFVLSKFDSKMAKYVAMESGHPLVDPALASALTNFVARNGQAQGTPSSEGV